MTSLPPLDTHAHIKPDIAPTELTSLGAVVFAASRNSVEGAQVVRRDDPTTVWGVGCHPGLVGVQKAFEASDFEALLDRTALASEVGLDGDSRVPMALQRATFRSILEIVRDKPRILSVHSYRATQEVLEELEGVGVRKGVILHWWLGSADETQHALDLGCYFAVNASSLQKWSALGLVPSERLLVETDHPFGDRRNRGTARPGNVLGVERGLARLLGVADSDVRRLMWTNLRALVQDTGVFGLLPRRVRVLLSAL